MEFNSGKYEMHKVMIDKHKNNGLTWDEIINLEFLNGNIDDKAKVLETLSIASGQDPITIEEWEDLVIYLKKLDRKVELNKLGRKIKNNAKIPSDQYSAWQLYKRNLNEKGFSNKSIDELERSSINILQSLSTDTKEEGPIKGLVVGNVQSGKTANMAGLMAMAADNGFNYFIVLSGVIENLRKQTANRLFDDMNSYGSGTWHWRHIDNPKVKSTMPEHKISNFNLSPKSRDKYFTVCLKNKSRLQELSKWLNSDLNKARQLKILIIDDEADQASINTKKTDDGEYTAINELIRNLVNNNNFSGMNYISYTATPYANVLNETSRDSLYPRDFISLLEPSEDYIGPKQLFGMEEPEKSPGIDIVLQIAEKDAEIIHEIQKGESEAPLPISFVESIQWFLITISCMRKLQYKKPISMLVHTSFKIDHHNIIAKKIKDYLIYMKNNFNKVIHNIKCLYEREKNTLTFESFKENMNGYSSLNKVANYPDWQDIKIELLKIFNLNSNHFVSHINLDENDSPIFHKGIHLAIDNSKANSKEQHVRLIYPDKNTMPEVAPAFIVVGGNTLSRGLTLEGLTTTYFLRTTNQADTLMQMGRWFGYRKGYELFPRVWMDGLAQERFTFLSQMNEELRDEIREYANNGNTPLDYAPRIKNSPNYKLIRITAKNKSQAAEPSEFDFAGFNSQTVYFENDVEILLSNINTTEEFLNKLPTPNIKGSKMIWNSIKTEKVNQFLKQYIVSKVDTKMSTLPALIEWLEKKGGEFEDWNIILSSIGDIQNKESVDNNWNIHNYSPASVNRSKLKRKSDNEITSIGALRAPSDLLVDIPEDSIKLNTSRIAEIQKIRSEYGLGKVPQLIIYKIDKNSMPNKDNSKAREPLNFKEDIIGVNIMIPSVQNKTTKNLTTYIKAKIDTSARSIDEDEYNDSEEE
ncbi:Z1 domain-containing protein [Staphylococcus xylosus]|uniref:Z1 domain-containing protein n=1 Tax=Staphylococcus xylosus TaxID=1288 RepID=UPI001F3BD40E|nr:Z1 domain-containing protein [Staphylococcus xylosus]MCE7782316.1 Z1 domain-containing protein [Staphylococcus xylosus]